MPTVDPNAGGEAFQAQSDFFSGAMRQRELDQAAQDASRTANQRGNPFNPPLPRTLNELPPERSWSDVGRDAYQWVASDILRLNQIDLGRIDWSRW